MLIKLTFKTPDVLDQIKEQIPNSYELNGGEEEREELLTKATVASSLWLKFHEYITVLIDTETGSCEVVPNG